MTVAAPYSGTPGQQFLAMLVVLVIGSIGGILLQLILKGIYFKTGKVGPYDIKPLCTKMEIPSLLGMIIGGCIARNFVADQYM